MRGNRMPSLDLSTIKWIKETETSLNTSTKKIYIENIGSAIEIWIDRERSNQSTFSPKQKRVFNNFINHKKSFVNNITTKLAPLGTEMSARHRITKSSLTKKSRFDLNFHALILPTQNKTENDYILLLADTNWKLKGSPYNMEIEILFKNNKILLIQEYTGLWCRLEWNFFYNKKVK